MRDVKDRPHAITFPDDGLTRASFAPECDVNRIIERYAETGIVPNRPRVAPQYGEVPDQTSFQAACIAAEAASAMEEDPTIGVEEKIDSEASQEVSDETEVEDLEKEAADDESGTD